MHPMAKRWVPDGQVGQNTVYRHEPVSQLQSRLGGEFMASTLFQAVGSVQPPNPEVLAAALQQCCSAQTIPSNRRSSSNSSSSSSAVQLHMQVPLLPSSGTPHWLHRWLHPWLGPQQLHLELVPAGDTSSPSQVSLEASILTAGTAANNGSRGTSGSSSRPRFTRLHQPDRQLTDGAVRQQHNAHQQQQQQQQSTGQQQWLLLIRSCSTSGWPPPPPTLGGWPCHPTTSTLSSSTGGHAVPSSSSSAAAAGSATSCSSKPLRWVMLPLQLLGWLLQLLLWLVGVGRAWANLPSSSPAAAVTGGVAVTILKNPDMLGGGDSNTAGSDGQSSSNEELCDMCASAAAAAAAAAADGAGNGAAANKEVFIACVVKAQLGGVWGPRSLLGPLADHWQLHAALSRQLLGALLAAAAQALQQQQQERQEQQQEGVGVPSAAAAGGDATGGAAAAAVSAAGSGTVATQGAVAGSGSGSGGGDAATSTLQGDSWVDPQPDAATGAFPRTGGCAHHIWSELHVPGAAAPFKVRGPGYLSGDKSKVPAGRPAFQLYSVDLVNTPTPVMHLGRYLPAVRRAAAPYSLVVNMMVPTSSQVINVVMAYGAHWTPQQLAAMVAAADQGQDSNNSSAPGNQQQQRQMGSAAADQGQDSGSSQQQQQVGGQAAADGACSSLPRQQVSVVATTGGAGSSQQQQVGPATAGQPGTTGSNPQQQQQGEQRGAGGGGGGVAGGAAAQLPPLPFARSLLKFLAGSDKVRSDMFKMIPHVAGGPWLLQRSVGTTPVILGHKMALRYHATPRYMEVDVDVTSCAVAGHIVSAVQGLSSVLTVDMAYLLEAHSPQELPEGLMGAVRFTGMDLRAGTSLDMSSEVPLRTE